MKGKPATTCKRPMPVCSKGNTAGCGVIHPKDMLRGLIRVLKARGFTKFGTMDEYQQCTRVDSQGSKGQSKVDRALTGVCSDFDLATQAHLWTL